MKSKSISRRIIFSAVLAVLVLGAGLVLVMSFFMNSLTDRILVDILETVARTSAKDVESNLHILADRLFLLRKNNKLIHKDDTDAVRKELDSIISGIEFVWLGVYHESRLFAGTDNSPLSIAGRKINTLIMETRNLAIEDTTVGPYGLEIVMGLPLEQGTVDGETYYLVGSYRYNIISDVLNSINVGAGGTAFIINEEGILIAHKEQGRVYSQEHFSNIPELGSAASSVLNLMAEGQIGSSVIPGPQGRTFLSYSPIRGTLWSLGIQVPRSSFLGPLHDAILTSCLITLAGVFSFILVFSAAIQRILTLPLALITENARHHAAGIFGSKLPPGITVREDEIGRLGQAYLTMSGSIQRVIDDISSLTRSARTGSLTERADVNNHQGDYHRIIAGINAMMEVFCSHLNAMPAALALFNSEAAPIYINKIMTEILKRHGFDRRDPRLLSTILNKTGWLALFDPREGLGTYNDDVSIKSLDGEICNYSITLQPILDEHSVMMILQDITQLTRAKSDAEAASTAKSNFLATMSHEMRTPMNAIIGMTTLAKGSDETDRKNYCLDKIENASKHLLGIINDVLDMSKIEANKFELSFQEFSFEKLLQRVTGVVTFKLEEKQQVFKNHADPAIPPLLVGDEQRLAQLVTNLLSNAVKFTPNGGLITLESRVINETEDTVTLEVTITDTGIGISKEQMPRLFDSFQQADSSISRKFGGTGLGLAISKNIVEMMHGSIRVDSKPGEGSSFTFTVELERVKAGARTDKTPSGKSGTGADSGTADSKDAEMEGGETQNFSESRALEEAGIGMETENNNFRGKRLLLAEDVEINREIVIALLEPTELEIDCAMNGAEAVDMFSRDPAKYNMIFMDVHMPEVDGFEATRRIRTLNVPEAKTIPIVAMTANVFRQDVENCLAAGMNDHIGKPLDFTVVLEKLRKYLRQ